MIVRLLGDSPTVEALRLAGIEGRALREGEDPARVFEEMLAVEDLGVLFVTENVAERMRARVDQAKIARHFPLVLEIPARGAEAVTAEDLVDRVAKLVGLKA